MIGLVGINYFFLTNYPNLERPSIDCTSSCTRAMMTTTTTATNLNSEKTTQPATTTPPKRVDWIVRPATPQDAHAVAEVLYASYSEIMRPDYEEDLLSKVVPYMSTARESLLTCGTWFVVEHPNTKDIVGCGGWTAEAPKMENLAEVGPKQAVVVPHLRHFACHPQWTRCGVGRAIWNRTWNEIAKQIGPNTSMEVFSTLTAVPFYGSLGFVEQKRIDIPLDGKSLLFPAVLMRREVATTRTTNNNNSSSSKNRDQIT